MPNAAGEAIIEAYGPDADKAIIALLELLRAERATTRRELLNYVLGPD